MKAIHLDFCPEALPAQIKEFTWNAVHHAPDAPDCLERCEDDEAEFYSIYAHDAQGLYHCIADLPDKRTCLNLMRIILRIWPHSYTGARSLSHAIHRAG